MRRAAEEQEEEAEGEKHASGLAHLRCHHERMQGTIEGREGEDEGERRSNIKEDPCCLSTYLDTYVRRERGSPCGEGKRQRGILT